MACRLVLDLMTITHKNVSPEGAMLSIKIKDKTLIKYFPTARTDYSFAGWQSWMTFQPFEIFANRQQTSIFSMLMQATIQF